MADLSDPIYKLGDSVRLVQVGCYAVIQRVHKAIGTFPSYDVLCDDGDEISYVVEYDMYPAAVENFWRHATDEVLSRRGKVLAQNPL